MSPEKHQRIFPSLFQLDNEVRKQRYIGIESQVIEREHHILIIELMRSKRTESRTAVSAPCESLKVTNAIWDRSVSLQKQLTKLNIT